VRDCVVVGNDVFLTPATKVCRPTRERRSSGSTACSGVKA
jgi:hypothetical protein